MGNDLTVPFILIQTNEKWDFDARASVTRNGDMIMKL